MPRQRSSSASAPPEATNVDVQDVATTTDQQGTVPDPAPSTSSSQIRQQSDNNANTIAAAAATSPIPTDVALTSSSQESTMLPDANAPVVLAESQVVMDAGGSKTSSSTMQSIPVSRTGLIRPTFSSTWERPSDPVAAIQPGIITASVFVLIGFAAVALMFARRWRRRRTRRRTRATIDFLNRSVYEEGQGDEKGSGLASPKEKRRVRGTILDMETGLIANNAGVGAHSDPAIDELRPPVAAKTRPDSVKGFKESPFPTVYAGVSPTPMVRFVLPHAPAKPSPLRVEAC